MCLVPCRWSERLVRLEDDERCAVSVCSILPDGVAPPVDGEAALGVLHAEEDDEEPESDTGVEPSREDVVVAHPPPKAVAADKVVEDEAGDSP